MAQSDPLVKTTFELPRSLLTRVKAYAALRNQPMRKVLEGALTDLLEKSADNEDSTPAWKELFGAFKDNPEEIDRIQGIIDEEFSRIDPEDWK